MQAKAKQQPEYRYTAKKAAVILLDAWLGRLSGDPRLMTAGDMTFQLEEYGWNITDIRRREIVEQAQKLLGPLQARLAAYIEGMQ